MGVQRTSFNHLFSGRNKPGFEFLFRLQSCYPSINLNWLIAGTGTITQSDDVKISQVEKYESESESGVDLFSNIFNRSKTDDEIRTSISDAENEQESDPGPTIQIETKPGKSASEQAIERLIIVYKDGRMVEIKH